MKYLTLILAIVLASFTPYLVFSTYFWYSAWEANGKGSDAGYRVLGMLPTLENYYWGSWFIFVVLSLIISFATLILSCHKSDCD